MLSEAVFQKFFLEDHMRLDFVSGLLRKANEYRLFDFYGFCMPAQVDLVILILPFL